MIRRQPEGLQAALGMTLVKGPQFVDFEGAGINEISTSNMRLKGVDLLLL